MDYTTQVICATSSSHPMIFTGAERVPLSLSSSPTVARPSRILKCRSYQLLSRKIFSGCLRRKGIFVSSKEHFLFHALSLQGVTTENDPEGSTSPGPSSSVDCVCTFEGDEGTRQSLFHYVQVWYINARKQAIPLTVKEVFDKSNVASRQIVKHLKSSKLDSYAVHWWQSTQPWIRWPFAIFVPWFLFISVIYGRSVSMDLTPLWIMGPIATALVIKACIEGSEYLRQWVANSKVTAGWLVVYEEAKTGQLPQHILEVSSSKFEEFKWAVTKKSDLVTYVQSGQMIAALKKYFEKKFLELQESSVDKYHDFRLCWLALERKLKNIV